MSAADLAVPRPAFAAPAPPAALTVDTVSDYESLLELEPAWTALVETSDVDHPFASHEWVRTWWECFGSGHQLHVLVVKAGAQALAIAPLMLSRIRFGGVSVRRLQLIANEQTPRADFIVGSRKPEAYRALWDCLAAQRPLWDALVLPQVPADSATLTLVPALAADDGFRVGHWRRSSDSSPWLPLRGTWDSYFAHLPRKHRANLRNRLKRIEGLGVLDVKTVVSGPEIGPALDEGLALEAAAWKGSGGTAIQCRPERRLFYTRLAAWAGQRGWLRLQFLTVDGRRVAFAYMLCFKKRLFLLKPGYDPEYSAYSPSNLLLSMVLRDGFARSLDAFEFLGENDSWKLDWTREARPHSWLFVFPDTPRGRVLHLAKFRLLPWIKRVAQAAVASLGHLDWPVPLP